VCASCGCLDDWTDCSLAYTPKQSAQHAPEEVIYWRRQAGLDPGSGPVAWHSLEKTNLAAKLGRAAVDEAQLRLTAPDPHRLTGCRRTKVEPWVPPPPPTP
jgi:hypothetical protein